MGALRAGKSHPQATRTITLGDTPKKDSKTSTFLDRLREHSRPGPGLPRPSRQLPESGFGEDFEGDHARDRISRKAEEERLTAAPEGQGFARSHAELVKGEDSTQLFDLLSNEIVPAGGDATGGQDDLAI